MVNSGEDVKARYFSIAASEKNKHALFYSGSVLTLINIIPVFGVIFLQWEAAHLVFLYWLENVFIGFLNLFKAKKAVGKLPSDIDSRTGNFREKQPPFRKNVSKLLTIIYFVFTGVHGIFVLFLFAVSPAMMKLMLPAAALLAASHLFSYFFHFIHREEYKVLTYHEVLFAPYQRMVILHLTVLFCGYLVVVNKTESLWPVLFMVFLKVILDLWKHVRSHMKLFPVRPDSVKKNTKFSPANPVTAAITVFTLLSLAGIVLFILVPGGGRIPISIFTLIFVTTTAGLINYYLGRGRRPGKIRFLLPFGCGIIPGGIEGILTLSEFRHRIRFLEVKLVCRGQKLIYRKSGNSESAETSEVSIWKKSKDLSDSTANVRDSYEVPVKFIIPAFLPPTIIGRSIANVTWKLEVNLREELPGGKKRDNSFTFTSIPIFKTDS